MTAVTPRVRALEAREDAPPAQHGVVRSILLHLLPGVAILAVYVALQPVAALLGLPALFALLAAVLLAGLPIQLGHLLVLGRRRNGRWSLDGVVLLRAPLRARWYALLVPLLLVWSFLWYGLLTPVADFVGRAAFGWLPAWFFRDDYSQVSRPLLLLMLAFLLVLNGVIAPVVEELYFRGYLLPRLSRFGPWAPVLHLVLFTLYHVWQPWLYPTLLVALFPLIFAVWRTRNVRLGILTHCALNLIGGLAAVGQLLGGS
jgi:CAAX protease family protein